MDVDGLDIVYIDEIGSGKHDIPTFLLAISQLNS